MQAHKVVTLLWRRSRKEQAGGSRDLNCPPLITQKQGVYRTASDRLITGTV